MNLLLILLATIGIVALQYWLYYYYWDMGLDANISFSSDTIFEGQSVELIEVITNEKFLPLPALHVKFQFHKNLKLQNNENTSFSDQHYRSDIFSIMPYQRITRTLPLDCPNRGYYAIHSMDVIAYNLLMTDALVSVMPCQTWLYVYPRPIEDVSIEIPFQKIMGSLISKRFIYPDPFAFRGIRQYEFSDPMNTINWKATAKTGDLMVNTHYSAVSQTIVLLLNVENSTYFPTNSLHEESIRLTAALSLRFLEASIPVRIVCNGLDVVHKEVIHIHSGTGKRQIEEINKGLSRIDLEQDAPDYAPFLQEELYSSTTDAIYVLIGASQRPTTCNALEGLVQKTNTLFWILPFHNDIPPKECNLDNVELIQWEVSRNAS